MFDNDSALSRRMSRSDQLVEILGLQIVGGDVAPGERLPSPEELGRRHGLSRPMVREALKSLGAKGLIASKTRVGTVVTPRTEWNFLDREVLGWSYRSLPRETFFRQLFEVRQGIEPTAAQLAATKGSKVEIKAIGEALNRMETVDPEGPAAIEADIDFHRAILVACHNDLLQQMGSLVAVGLGMSFEISKEPYAVSMPLHRPVYEAIAARQPAEAHAAMQALLDKTFDYIASLKIPRHKR
jgi:DNA-binding FadR family transcriptional regulator